MLCALRALYPLLFSTCVLAALSTAQVSFNQTAINSGDTTTSAITTGDFDNDGILDLITVNNGSLSFYKGLGGGSYASPVNQPLTQYSGQIVAGDFNHDGRLDLAIVPACCSTSGGVTILLGNGDGSFAQGTNIIVTGGATFIALADFSGDHLPDIAVSMGSGGTDVFLGQGDGTFKLSATLDHGAGQLVAGDFDADGHQDIAVADGTYIALYRGNGDGTFKSARLARLKNVSSIAVGDFFSNRIQSLAALVTIFLGGGNFENDLYTLRFSHGVWLAGNRNIISPQNGDPYMRLIGGDLNGDFKDDVFLVGGNFQGSAVSAYALGNGDGTFQPLVSAPQWMDLQDFPFIRDLDLDSRHDVGIAWTSIFESTGGAEVLLNTSATANCTPPAANALSVHICAPTNGQVVGKTFTFRGAGNAWNGFAKRMELWIDGKKVGQNLEDQLRVTTALTNGPHTAAFVVVDSFDKHVAGSVSFKASY